MKLSMDGAGSGCPKVSVSVTGNVIVYVVAAASGVVGVNFTCAGIGCVIAKSTGGAGVIVMPAIVAGASGAFAFAKIAPVALTLVSPLLIP